MRITLFLILIFATLIGAAQKNKDKSEDGSTRVKRLVEQAEEAFYYENYRRALKLFHKLDTVDTLYRSYYRYKIGLCHMNSKIENEKSIEYMRSSIKYIVNDEEANFIYYNLGKAYHVNNRFEEAIKAYKKAEGYSFDEDFIKEIRRSIEVCKNGLNLMRNPSNARVRNGGLEINSPFPDYKPVVSADESTLIFTSRKKGSTGKEKDLTGRYYEDIYISSRDELGNWSRPEKMDGNINSPLDEASVGLSADGQELFIYKGRMDGGEIYKSTRMGDQWGLPVKMGKEINSKFWEISASMSPDQRTIYFISDRKGSLGGRDVYISRKEGDEWSEPENLGNVINTKYDEESPYIHPDGKTLYFSSKGHNSIGGFDIYKTINENGTWSEPENLGFPINSATDDAHFVLIANGKRGFFSSGKTGGYGEQDVYMVEFNDAIVPLVLVRGNITSETARAKITLTIIADNNQEIINQLYQPDIITGRYLIILSPGYKYKLLVQNGTDVPFITEMDLTDLSEFREIIQNIHLTKDKRIEIKSKRKNLIGNNKEINSNLDYLKILTEKLNESKDSQGNTEELLSKVYDITESESASIARDSVPDFVFASNATGVITEINTANGLVKVIQTELTQEKERIIDWIALNDKLGRGKLIHKGITYFNNNEHLLDIKQKEKLNNVYAHYLQTEHKYIKIIGYTDEVGSDIYNLKLSKKRTNSIEKYFIALGVPKEFIIKTAAGELKGSSDIENKINRRAEYFIVGK